MYVESPPLFLAAKRWWQYLIAMRNLTVLFTLFACLLTDNLLAQTRSDNDRGRTSLLFQFGGPELLGVHVNVLIADRITVNAGLGFDLDAHIGSSYYLIKSENSGKRMYVGFELSTIQMILISGDMSGVRQIGVYFPIGYELITQKGFTFQIDIGPNLVKENWGQFNTFPIIVSIKIGITPKKKG